MIVFRVEYHCDTTHAITTAIIASSHYFFFSEFMCLYGVAGVMAAEVAWKSDTQLLQ